MNRYINALVIVCCICLLSSCHISRGARSSDRDIFVYFLVRHAEKDNNDTRDPDLSSAGRLRALRLAELLRDWPVDAMYSSDYKRTRQTLAPLAEARNKVIQTYWPNEQEDFARRLLRSGERNVVVAGHSNSIPRLVNLLAEDNRFTDLPDDEYGTIFMIIRTEGRRPEVRMLRY